MTSTQLGTLEHIQLSAIRPSTTNPRKHFDPAALEELTASIRELGVTVPIHVRSVVNHEKMLDERFGYEIVTGERRFRAAQAAGLTEIPAMVFDELDDASAMDLQLVENLQRADLHPVEEAEGYRALMAHGATAEDVAKKAGKTLGYVQQRLKLLSLEVDAKQLFADGHITLGHALLLARLTAKDQERALLYLLGTDVNATKDKTAAAAIAKAIAGPDYSRFPKNMREEFELGRKNERLVDPTEAQLKNWITSHVLLQLKGVPWDLGDAALLPIAGPCTTCPKRTGANQALFSDLTTNEDTCTDPACFADKQKAFTVRAQELAKEQGTPLLKISSKHSTDKLEKPAVEIRASAVKLQQGKAVETQRAVVVATKPVKEGQWVASKKGACPATVQAIATDGADQGKLRYVCADQACKVHQHVVQTPRSRPSFASSMNQNTPENRAKAERERKIAEAAEAAILSALDSVDAKHARMLEYLLVEAFEELWNSEAKQQVCQRLEIAVSKPKNPFDPKWEEATAKRFDEWLGAATLPEMHDAAMWILVERFNSERINELAERAGIDPKAIEKTVRAKFEADEKAAAPQQIAASADKGKKKAAAKKKAGK